MFVPNFLQLMLFSNVRNYGIFVSYCKVKNMKINNHWRTEGMF